MVRDLLQPTHLIFILLIVLIIFGPGKLPDLGRSLGKGLREFKEWFYPTWEPTYLVSSGGTKRPLILANIASLISGSLTGTFRAAR